MFLLTKKNISIPLYKDQKIISQSRGIFPNLNLKSLSKQLLCKFFKIFTKQKKLDQLKNISEDLKIDIYAELKKNYFLK